MKYECDICKYKTDDSGNWNRHIKSIKHIQQIELNKKYYCKDCDYYTYDLSNYLKHKKTSRHLKIKNYNNLDTYICEHCKNKYKYISSLQRHKNECSKKIEEFVIIENNIIKENNDFLKKMIEKKDDIIIGVGKLLTSNMTAMRFLTSYINNPPVLQKFNRVRIEEIVNDDETIKRNNLKYPNELEMHFSEHVIYKYKHNMLLEFLSELIVKEYKKIDPTKQAMWVSDIPRIIFTVTKNFKNKDQEQYNESEKNQNCDKSITIIELDEILITQCNNNSIINWTYDKKGFYVRELVVDPLLDYVLNKMNKYIELITIWINDNFDSYLREYKQAKLSIALDIMSEIRCKSINKKLVKEIAPRFYISNEIMDIVN
jgi:hypothetical protein